MSSRLVALSALLPLVTGCGALHDGSRPAATPQRPTLSVDTNTTAQGTFELESGVAFDPDSTFSAPTTLKWGAGERTELFVSASLYDWAELPDGDEVSSFGDTFVGARQRFLELENGVAGALQLSTKIPTAEEGEGLGNGEHDFFIAGSLSASPSKEVFLWLFYEAGLLGDPDDSGNDVQHSFSVNGSKTFDGVLAIFGEVATIDGPDGYDPTFGTIGVQHIIAPSLVWDAGFVVGFNDDAQDLQFVVGFTSNLGQ